MFKWEGESCSCMLTWSGVALSSVRKESIFSDSRFTCSTSLNDL